MAGIGGLNQALVFVRLSDDAPGRPCRSASRQPACPDGGRISVSEVASGPPTSGLELGITGADYEAISDVTRQLVDEVSTIDGIVNVTSDVTEARTRSRSTWTLRRPPA